MTIPNSPPIYNQKHDYKAFKWSWEWSWMDKNLQCSPATKRYTQKKSGKNRENLTLKKTTFRTAKTWWNLYFSVHKKKIWALKNPKLFTGPQCSNFSENWAETVTFWKTGAGMVIQHQQTLLYVTKSANGPKLPRHEKYRDQIVKFLKWQGQSMKH